MIIFMVFLYVFHAVFSYLISVDLTKCKITHKGTEYVGKLTRTETNLTCSYWQSTKGKESELLVDEAFPEGSMALSKNYCRNPNQNPNGPWCYTTPKELIFDTCDVPLCKVSECRISGTGMEYSGWIVKSASGKKCEKWKNKPNLKMESKFNDLVFPDGSINQAGNKCRNPDGSISGPWCYVERDDGILETKELCDIPFCDDIGSMTYASGNVDEYFFFSSINESTSLNISVRLWDPSDWLKGEVFLYLSLYDTEADRSDIERWDSGVEIRISHNGSGMLSREDFELKKTPLILSGANWTNLKITWVNLESQTLLIRLYKIPNSKPIGIKEIHLPNSIFQIKYFQYIALGGSPALWNIASSNSDDCPVHTVTRQNTTRFWFIKKTILGKNVEIFIRAFKAVVITMRTAPMVEISQIQVVFENNKIKIYSKNDKNETYQITDKSWTNALTFWKWEYFKITLFKKKLQLFWIQKVHTDLILEAHHENIDKVMWITFGSPRVSYWAIYCDPQGASVPPSASPPECVTHEADLFYGTQRITSSGQQCIPWTDKSSLPERYRNNSLFTLYGGRENCQNFCRNLDNDPKGAYCFIKDSNSESGFAQTYCHPRLCSLSDCQQTGTGSDCVGKLNITRSKRKTEVNDDLIKALKFPDRTVKDVGNSSGNPSGGVGGSGCFTKDRRVPRDNCYVKDCEKSLQCSALVAGLTEGTFIYITPPWRKNGLHFWLKAWNPDIYEGLIISMYSMDGLQEYKLLIGAEDNEKTKLLYKTKSKEILLIQKTLPHLVPTGKWKGFWLRTGHGKIELGYDGVSYSFFEWTASAKEPSFKPMFINFGTILNSWIGIHFQCNECLTIQTFTGVRYHIYPINLWRDEPLSFELSVNLRGTGTAFVTLGWSEGNAVFHLKKKFTIAIMANIPNIFFVENNENICRILASFTVSSGITANKWSEYRISFTERSLVIHKDKEFLVQWRSGIVLLFYWFTVTAEEGRQVIWSANCPAADIDGAPRDGNWGKWGPWSCSVSCGKGHGVIKRQCNDPPPNIFGEDCKGLAVYEGPCNDFPCGKISPNTVSIIREYLSSQYKSLQVDVASRIVLPCNPRALSLIMAEVSEVNITWTHNGFPYSKTKFHLNDNYGLVIPRAQEKHNGIYLCMAYQDPNSIPSKIVLEVISLVVIKPKPNKKVRTGKSLTLKCNGLSLSHVYADLSQRWELNGTVKKEYGLGTMQMFTVDKLENISDSHAGIWTCIIIQEDFKFKWTTNWIYLRVKSAPNFWARLMEDVTTAPLFGKLGNERNAKILFFTLIGLSTTIILIVTYMFVKVFTKTKKN